MVEQEKSPLIPKNSRDREFSLNSDILQRPFIRQSSTFQFSCFSFTKMELMLVCSLAFFTFLLNIGALRRSKALWRGDTILPFSEPILVKVGEGDIYRYHLIGGYFELKATVIVFLEELLPGGKQMTETKIPSSHC